MASQSVAAPAAGEKKTVAAQAGQFLLRYGAYLALVLVFVYFSVRSPVFLTVDNMIRILQQTAVLAIAAFGMTVVVVGGGQHVIEGGIDLSIGAQVGLLTGIYSVLMANGYTPAAALGVGLAAGLLVGLLNGLSVAYIRLVPLLVTLAMMNIVGGAELLVTNNLNINLTTDFIRYLADGTVLGLPVGVVILLVTFLAYYVFLELTPIGQHIRAIGGNRDTAVRTGLRVKPYVVVSYMLSSLAAAISSVVLIGRVSGSTRGIGSLIFLDILLAAYVSAMFSSKWVLTIPGTFLGAIFVGVLSNGFTMANVPTFWVFAVKGVLILFVVSATSLQKKRASDQ